MEKLQINSRKIAQLNPFAFPSDTGFNFILLITAVIGSALYIFLWFFYKWNSDIISKKFECIQKIDLPEEGQGAINNFELSNLWDGGAQSYLEKFEQVNQYLLAYHTCGTEFERHLLLWNIGGLCLLLIVAGIIYWVYPKWKIWRKNLEPFPVDTMPEIATYLSELCDISGLRQQPKFYLSPYDMTISGGFAFGRRGQYCIALPLGLVKQYSDNLSTFRAIVLHELAHIRNGDIGKTYFALSIGSSFFLVCVIPFLLVDIDKVFSKITIGGGVNIILLTVIVYAILKGFLRTREFYADARASILDNSPVNLEHVLQSAPSNQRNWLNRFQTSHPSPKERCQKIQTPNLLFKFNYWNSFSTGLVIGIIFSALNRIASFTVSLLPGYGSDSAETVVMIFLTPLIIGIIGFGLWRGFFAQWILRKKIININQIAISLSIGLLIGLLVSFDTSLDFHSLIEGKVIEQEVDLFDQFSTKLTFNIIWSVALTTSICIFFHWLSLSYLEWIKVSKSRKQLNRSYIICSILSSIVLTCILGYFFLIGEFKSFPIAIFSLFLSLNSDGSLPSLISRTATFIALISIGLLPLLPTILKLDNKGNNHDWAFINLSSTPVEIAEIQPRSLKRMRTTAWKSAIFSLFLLLLLNLLISASFPPELKQTTFFKFIFYITQILWAIITQLIVAIKVTRNETDLKAVKGYCAAFLSGLFMAIGIRAIDFSFAVRIVGFQKALTLFTNVQDPFSFSQILGGGIFITTPIILLVAVITSRRSSKKSEKLEVD